MHTTDVGRRRVGRLAAVVLSGLMVFVLAACEGGLEQETVQEPEQTDQQDDTAEDSDDEQRQERLQLGESVVLSGMPAVVGESENAGESGGDGDDGEGQEEEEEIELEVTASEFLDPVTAVDEEEAPREGARLVAVELELENVGEEDYEGSVASAGELFPSADDDEGEQPALTEVDECELIGDEEEPTEINLDSGDSRSGCMVFEVDDDSDPELFEYELGPETVGLWELN